MAVNSLCSLLAYSIYKNQLLQARLNLESSFSTSTTLNSRIHHAANLLYSVPRGRCPYITITNAYAVQTLSPQRLDQAFTYNGYYFYFRNDNVSWVKDQMVEPVNFICCNSRAKECVVTGSNISDDLFFIDFLDENISEDILLSVTVDSTQGPTYPKTTSDINQFYQKQATSSGESEYIYDYLTITLPSYGVRLMRHSDSAGWGGAQSFTLKYLPYSESVPDFSNLRSVTGLRFNTQLVNDPEAEPTIVTINGYEERTENLEDIYSRAVEAYHAQGTVATIYDLESLLATYDPSATFKVYTDLELIQEGENEYSTKANPLYVLVMFSNSTSHDEADFRDLIENWMMSLDVASNETIQVKEAVPTVAKEIWVEAYSDTTSLTNEELRKITDSYASKIGETISHSQFEADVIRLGYKYVKCYTDSSGETEWIDAGDGLIECKEWEYPNIVATALIGRV